MGPWPPDPSSDPAAIEPAAISGWKLLEKEAHLALWGLGFLWPLLRGTKRAGAEGAPTRQGGEGHPRARLRRRARLAPGCSGKAGCDPGRQGRSRPPRPARASRAVWRPPQPFASSRPLYFYPLFSFYYYDYDIYIFPAQSGKPGLPKRAAEGPPFPGESAARGGTGRPGKGTGGECPAPSPPPRRPGAHGAHGARGARLPRSSPRPRPRRPRPRPDLPSGAARPRPPAPGPFPPARAPAPLPLSARGGPAPSPAPSEAPERPTAPERSPRRPGASLLRSGPPNSASREPSAPSRAGLAAARRWTPHPAASSLLAQDAPRSSPAAAILPLLSHPPPRLYFARKQVGQLDLLILLSFFCGEGRLSGCARRSRAAGESGALSGPGTAPAARFVSRPRSPLNNNAIAMAGSPGAAPPAPGARCPRRAAPGAQVRPARRRCRAGLFAFLWVLSVLVNGGKRQFSGPRIVAGGGGGGRRDCSFST